MNEKIEILKRIGRLLSLSGKRKEQKPQIPEEIAEFDKLYELYSGFYHAVLGEYVAELIDIAASKKWPKSSRFHSWDKDDFYQAIFVPPGIDRDEIYAANKKAFDVVKKKVEKRIADSYTDFVEYVSSLHGLLAKINAVPELKDAASRKFYFNTDQAEKRLLKLSKLPKAKYTKTLLNWGEWVDDPKQTGQTWIFDPFFEDTQELYYGYYDFS